MKSDSILGYYMTNTRVRCTHISTNEIGTPHSMVQFANLIYILLTTLFVSSPLQCMVVLINAHIVSRDIKLAINVDLR